MNGAPDLLGDIDDFDLEKRSNFTKPWVILACSIASAALGAAYIIVQCLIINDVTDALFVSLSIFAAMTLLCVVGGIKYYLFNRGKHFYRFITQSISPEQGNSQYSGLCRSLTDTRLMVISGAGYGILVGSSPFLLNIWENHLNVKISLAIFLFAVNFVTGMGLYSLVHFFISAARMGKVIVVDLW